MTSLIDNSGSGTSSIHSPGSALLLTIAFMRLRYLRDKIDDSKGRVLRRNRCPHSAVCIPVLFLGRVFRYLGSIVSSFVYVVVPLVSCVSFIRWCRSFRVFRVFRGSVFVYVRVGWWFHFFAEKLKPLINTK